MKCDLVVLDIDGVMVDVSESYREAIRQAVAAVAKKAVTNADIAAMKRIPGSNNDWDVSYALAYGATDFSAIDRASAAYANVKDAFQAVYRSQKLYERDRMLVREETLAAIAARAKLAVVTSRPRDEALSALRAFIPKYFSERLIVALEDCAFEKPRPEPLLLAKERAGASSVLYVGDTVNDAQCAKNAGARFVSVAADVPADFVVSDVNAVPGLLAARAESVSRETKETRIAGSVVLDGKGESYAATGIGFFDHLLASFAKHGHFDLSLCVQGDVNVDCHHSVEDAGIVLGRLFRGALGDKRGIARFGSALIPMDEALALAAVDLDSRGTLSFTAEFRCERVGELETETIREFFGAFARECGCSLHLKVLYGRNAHHMAEALFKAFGRAMRSACEIDSRVAGVASTKGVM